MAIEKLQFNIGTRRGDERNNNYKFYIDEMTNFFPSSF